jgi:DNA-binding beta-propeller fold protein YncE
LGSKGSGNGEFGNLHGIAIDKTTGWIYVADTANNRIQVFKPAKAPQHLIHRSACPGDFARASTSV